MDKKKQSNLIIDFNVGDESESLIYDPNTETLTVKRDTTGKTQEIDKMNNPYFTKEDEEKLKKAMKDLKDIFDSAEEEEGK